MKQPPAHIFFRIFAIVLDHVIISSILLIIYQYYFHQSLNNITLDNTTFIYFVIISFLYFILLESIFGKTIGKKIFNIEVQKTNGTKPTFFNILLRNLIRPIDMIGFYLLGFILIVFSPSSQRLGDMLAGTYVTYSNN
jgi:uncharacterized RDD family membrane protein YckC